MTAFDVDDELFSTYRKKEIINGFAQKPIKLENLIQEVSGQVHSYEMLKVGFWDVLKDRILKLKFFSYFLEYWIKGICS